ncbi:hypothetical protein [Paenibacillus sp. Marseille-Q4541]|uniref:hypothetical protein n=1 Tax=Paenibacillus sp. Marseille-Q4541 TaxID=2831522 RepID=UPI001BAE532C|nr:hypothetical protein [Paenibacillus sp. Marseille-Q4541]
MMKYRVVGQYFSASSSPRPPKYSVIIVSSSDIMYFLFTEMIFSTSLYAALHVIHAPYPIITSILGTSAFKRWVLLPPAKRQVALASHRRKTLKLHKLKSSLEEESTELNK